MAPARTQGVVNKVSKEGREGEDVCACVLSVWMYFKMRYLIDTRFLCNQCVQDLGTQRTNPDQNLEEPEGV